LKSQQIKNRCINAAIKGASASLVIVAMPMLFTVGLVGYAAVKVFETGEKTCQLARRIVDK